MSIFRGSVHFHPLVSLFLCITGFSDRQNKKVLSGFVLSIEYLCGRGDWIRTSGLYVPNALEKQARCLEPSGF